MRTAVITGASSGLGRELVRQIAREFPEVECFWLIARREQRLRELAGELGARKVYCMALDLCDEKSFDTIAEQLREEQPEITLLVNNAGCGYLGNIADSTMDRQTTMTKLNVTALTAMTSLCLPYMPRGAHIINISSIASFCPNPRLTVYSATKFYVSAYSRGLGVELRERGITVTAICPGPMATEFVEVGGITGNSPQFERLPYCDPAKVAHGAVLAAKAGRAVYTPTAFYKFYRFAAKVVPQRWMIKATGT